MLYIDYDKEMAQVRELRQIADEMARIRNQKLGCAVDDIRSNWKGSVGMGFLAKCDDFGSGIDKEVKSLRLLADHMEAEANRKEREAAKLK